MEKSETLIAALIRSSSMNSKALPIAVMIDANSLSLLAVFFNSKAMRCTLFFSDAASISRSSDTLPASMM